MDQASCCPAWLGWVLTSLELRSPPSAVEQPLHTVGSATASPAGTHYPREPHINCESGRARKI